MLNPTKVLDAITAAKMPWTIKEEERPPLFLSRETVLGMAYNPGQTVYYTVSEKEVVVLGGTRETVTIPAAGS